MKKLLSIILVPLFLFSCQKQTTELEVSEKMAEVEKEEVKQVTEETETKPLQVITKDDTLEIWVRADGAPGMFLNDNNELEGFYVDLEKAVMKEMGQKYHLNSYTDLGPVVVKIKSGEGHEAIATPILPDYKALANISISFETLFYVIFLPSDSTEVIPDNKEEAIKSLYGKKVGVQTRGHIYQMLRDYKDIEIVEYPTTTVAMEALHNGEVDAVPEVKRVGLYYANLNNWNVKPVGPSIFSLDIGTSFSKTLDQSVVDRYNTALQKLIDNGFVKKLYKDYFGE
ncbi:MAG: transporter substrate-binding domain-containing protein [Spirochaetales bacterium]|nr:transporter substrate-binding domain-containing protein [Spirochaetales bacterium]